MKSTLFPLMMLFFSVTAFAGENWKSYFKNSEVEILYREAECHDNTNGIHQKKVLLKVVNLQNRKVEVFYTKELTFSNNTTTKPDVREFSVTLAPYAAIEGECTTRDNRLYIFAKQLDFSSTELTKFELTNVIVKPIQQ